MTRVALVHDWFRVPGGSERAFAEILKVVPDADVFALFDVMPEADRGFLGGREVQTSFLQRLPGLARDHRRFLPLMPAAVRSLDLRGYDLVVSSSHSFAKSVRVHEGQRHVCYCYSPMRWAWDLEDEYLGDAGLGRGLKGRAARAFFARLRAWDARTAAGVDRFVAISGYIADRIRRAYGRESDVVYPPVEADDAPRGLPRGDHDVTVGRLVPYKRVDVLVEAYRAMPERRLVVVGDGPERAALERRAPPNVVFRGRLPRADLLAAVATARAFVYAAEEDFGIAMAEAIACGTPVVAYARGGAAEIVENGATGRLFGTRDVEAVAAAVRACPVAPLDAERARASAERFRPPAFRKAFEAVIERGSLRTGS